MEEQKNGFIQWVKDNKKELIVAGVSIVALMGIIVGLKNKDSIIALWESLRKTMGNSPIKMQTVSREIVVGIVHEPAQVIEVASATEIIKFPSNHNSYVPFEVCEHVRNLPDGWHASAKKITTAAEYGYNLKPGQTWVDTYTKGVSVA